MFRRAKTPPPPAVPEPTTLPLPPSPFASIGAYAPDVADAASVAERLKDTDIFGAATAERDGYLADALERFRVTMSLLPALPQGARILELGANPYLAGVSDSVQTVTKNDGSQREYRFAHFDVESETFPYADDSFDLVLCCEILEHLPVDPIHMLVEIHRVLRKPDGALLLTTPNAVRLQNLANILNGANVYESLSGYGVHGRHNREYTPAELGSLLASTGFEPEAVHAIDVHGVPHGITQLPEGANPNDRGDNLFALARAAHPAKRAYEPWLFTSIHAIQAARTES